MLINNNSVSDVSCVTIRPFTLQLSHPLSMSLTYFPSESGSPVRTQSAWALATTLLPLFGFFVHLAHTLFATFYRLLNTWCVWHLRVCMLVLVRLDFH